MIGRLRGILLEKKPPSLLIDVNGVGYEVDAPMSTFYALPEVGQEVILYTHLVVREDAHQLYGFAGEADRYLFRELIKVTGVGAKMALTILSGITSDAFVQCINDDDSASLTRLPGVGKKTAQRLVMEMRDRLSSAQGTQPAAAPAGVVVPERPQDAAGEAVSALVALGYKPQEASKLVGQVEAEGLASEEVIRRALQAAAR